MWSIPTHQKPSTPFDSTLQTTCHPRSRHTERPRCEVKSSMSIKRWLRKIRVEHEHESVQSRQHRHPPANKFTDLSRWRVMLTLRQPLNVLCADITVRVAIRLCAGRGAHMRSPETVSNHLPPFLSHRISTHRNVRSSRSSSCSRTSQSKARVHQQHSVRLPQKLDLPCVNVRFAQEHVATIHTFVTCLKLKSRDPLARSLRHLCDHVSS